MRIPSHSLPRRASLPLSAALVVFEVNIAKMRVFRVGEFLGGALMLGDSLMDRNGVPRPPGMERTLTDDLMVALAATSTRLMRPTRLTVRANRRLFARNLVLSS
mgnify:CR=1 FL=1